jgi:WD40 repeat protein
MYRIRGFRRKFDPASTPQKLIKPEVHLPAYIVAQPISNSPLVFDTHSAFEFEVHVPDRIPFAGVDSRPNMKANFRFHNLCGTVYRQGNVLFTPDGNSVLSPVGNRVSVFDLVSNKSRTLPFENRKNIACIALSPDGNLLLSIDEGQLDLSISTRIETDSQTGKRCSSMCGRGQFSTVSPSEALSRTPCSPQTEGTS